MGHSFVLDGCNQQRGEQDVCHLSVEEVHSVVGLGHHGGVVSACGVVLHTLPTRPPAAEGTDRNQRRRKQDNPCYLRSDGWEGL